MNYKTISFYMFLLLSPTCFSINEMDIDIGIGIGIGIGIDYGHSGLKLEKEIISNFQLHAAIGRATSIGVDYKFLADILKYNPKYSPRIGITYGRVHFRELSKRGQSNTKKFFYGYALVLGTAIQNDDRNRYFDIGFTYYLSDGGSEEWAKDKIAENYRVVCCNGLTDAVMHFNIGYNIRF